MHIIMQSEKINCYQTMYFFFKLFQYKDLFSSLFFLFVAKMAAIIEFETAYDFYLTFFKHRNFTIS